MLSQACTGHGRSGPTRVPALGTAKNKRHQSSALKELTLEWGKTGDNTHKKPRSNKGEDHIAITSRWKINMERSSPRQVTE